MVETVNKPEVILTGRSLAIAGEKHQQTLNNLEFIRALGTSPYRPGERILARCSNGKFKVTVRRVMTQTFYRIQRELDSSCASLSTAHEILERGEN